MVYIWRLFPNPAGKDTQGEFIEIHAQGGGEVLDGWHIQDKAGKSFKLYGTIQGGESRSFSYAQTKISLNNNGETITLFNQKGEVVDSVSYETSKENIILQRASDGSLYEQKVTSSQSEIQNAKDSASKESITADVPQNWNLEKTALISDTNPPTIFIGIGVALMWGVIFWWWYTRWYKKEDKGKTKNIKTLEQ